MVEMKKDFLHLLENERSKRKRERFLNRGFKPKDPSEDPETEAQEDPEIAEEHPEFDRRKHEIEMLESLFKETASSGCFINGNFFEVEEDKVGTPFLELLTESKVLPEFVVLLKVKETNFIKRVFDDKEIK